MATNADLCPDARDSRDAYPTFDLTFRYDDVEDPVELTVFPEPSADRTTAWLTVDVDHAVPLDCLR